jgi:hypothetical protein
VLFFGCRRAEEDFIYERELKGYAADRTLTGLHIAFSRDGPNKVYVQNLLREEGKAVWGYLSGAESRPAAHVYVCGATRMGHDVLEALEAVRRREGGGGVCLLPRCSSAPSHPIPPLPFPHPPPLHYLLCAGRRRAREAVSGRGEQVREADAGGPPLRAGAVERVRRRGRDGRQWQWGALPC